MRLTYHLAAMVAILGAASPARADQTYRISVGATDVISGAAFASALQMDLDHRPVFVLAAAGLTGMALGAPILHAWEDNYARMSISLGSRLLFPTLGLVVVARRPRMSVNKVLAGFMAGFAVATAIDIAMASSDDSFAMTSPSFRF